jgi:hypothetical protein
MDFHGITMKGKYYAEQVTSPTGADTIGRIVVNTSTTANGVADTRAQNKIFFNNGTYWLRPLIANGDDAPDQDSQWDLGNSSKRWRRIYADDFFGSVRYS